MPVTDLTNTTWLFNKTIDFSPLNFTSGSAQDAYLTVNITSNETNYSLMYVYHASNNIVYIYYGYSKIAYQSNAGWKDNAYRFVTVTGGSKVTDETVIAFFETNAVQYSTPYFATEAELTSVADAIRAKTGSTEPLVFPQGFVDAINEL